MSSIKDQIRQEIERRLKYTHDWLRGDEKRHPNQSSISKNYYKMKGDERTLDALLSFIDSLPDEEPSKGLDVTDFCKPIDPGIAQCIADNWWEMIDEQPSKELEEELYKYIDNTFTVDDSVVSIPREYRHYYLEEDDMMAIARHFAEWGRMRFRDTEKSQKEINDEMLPLDVAAEDLEEAAKEWAEAHYKDLVSQQVCADDFIAGAKWQAKHSPLPEDSVAFNNGVEEGKRLMMEEAVEGEIGYWNQRGLSIRLDKSLEKLGYDEDTKVKIIIIKGND